MALGILFGIMWVAAMTLWRDCRRMDREAEAELAAIRKES